MTFLMKFLNVVGSYFATHHKGIIKYEIFAKIVTMLRTIQIIMNKTMFDNVN